MTEFLQTPKLGKFLGRKVDLPDWRDQVYRPTALFADSSHPAPPLPSCADAFHGLNLPVYDQGALGSCTANAGVLYRRFLAQRFSQYSAPDQDLSRLFLYYQERKLPWNNDINSDSGACIRDVCYTLAHVGACPASDDNYDPAQFASARNDTPEEIQQAASYKIGAYHRLLLTDDIRACIASGYAALLGFTVYESFEDIGPDEGYIMPLPKPGERVMGGHAVVIHAYDDQSSAPGGGLFQIQNSWGAEWGENGNFYMPYELLQNAQLSQPDIWMCHLGEPWKEPA